MSNATDLIVASQFNLRRCGWEANEIAPKFGVLWTVYAKRGEHYVVAKSADQTCAWIKAELLARKVDATNLLAAD